MSCKLWDCYCFYKGLIGAACAVDESRLCCRNATNSSSDLQTDSSAAASTSLIPETLEEMQADTEFQQTAARLRRLGQAAMTREEKQKRQRSLDRIGVPSFGAMVKVKHLTDSYNAV